MPAAETRALDRDRGRPKRSIPSEPARHHRRRRLQFVARVARAPSQARPRSGNVSLHCAHFPTTLSCASGRGVTVHEQDVVAAGRPGGGDWPVWRGAWQPVCMALRGLAPGMARSRHRRPRPTPSPATVTRRTCRWNLHHARSGAAAAHAAVRERLDFSGPLVAPQTAVLRAKAPGTLLSLDVAEGSRVQSRAAAGPHRSGRAGQPPGRAWCAASRSARATLAQAERAHASTTSAWRRSSSFHRARWTNSRAAAGYRTRPC
jgi:hypothetical protein